MPETSADEYLKNEALSIALMRAMREVSEKYREEIQARAKELLPSVVQEILDEVDRGAKLS